MTKNLTALIVLALAVAACGSATDDTTPGGDSCAKDDLTLVTEGTLTIATGEPAFPPYVVDDDPTNKQGFEAAVAYAVAGEHRCRPEGLRLQPPAVFDHRRSR